MSVATEYLKRTALAAWRPPPRLTVSEWADRYRRLSAESSAEPGRWRTSRAEYQRGMMDALTEPGIHTLVIMTSAQVGKTEVINNIIGYYVHQDPSPMILLQPTIQMAQAWSKDRLAPMTRDSEVLRGLIRDPRSRDANNTILHKQFPGGHITMAGANSAASLASRPVRVVLCDEVDRYPISAGTEGDPVSLAVKRSATFWNRRIVMTSTPTIRGGSRIEQAYEASDQRRYYVPCPDCGQHTTVNWSDIKWDEGDPSSARWECPACTFTVACNDQLRFTRDGEWRATATAPGVAGFHINELCSSWRKWSEVVSDFIQAREVQKTGDFSLMQVWVNTSLGETWEEVGHTVDGMPLFNRREHYRNDFPAAGNVLTIGADVQNNRVEWETVAWGEGEESWGVDYRVLHGDLSSEAFWDRLAAMMLEPYTRGDDLIIDPSLICIDSGGHFTDEVYAFCRKNGRKFIPVKGSSLRGQPVAKMPRKMNAKRVYLTTVGTDTGKEVLYQRYDLDDPGPGYCHYPIKPCYNETYFEQATAEKKVKRYVKGLPVYEWHLPGGHANEALDCRNYAFAAVRILQQYFGTDLGRVTGTPKKKAPTPAPAATGTGFVNHRRGGWFDR